MQVSTFKVAPQLYDQLITHLVETILFDYHNINPGMTIFAAEEYYFRTGSNQLNMIVLKKMREGVYIDLVGGGGGTGLLSLSWGSEKSFIRKAKHVIKDFCQSARNLWKKSPDSGRV